MSAVLLARSNSRTRPGASVSSGLAASIKEAVQTCTVKRPMAPEGERRRPAPKAITASAVQVDGGAAVRSSTSLTRPSRSAGAADESATSSGMGRRSQSSSSITGTSSTGGAGGSRTRRGWDPTRSDLKLSLPLGCKDSKSQRSSIGTRTYASPLAADWTPPVRSSGGDTSSSGANDVSAAAGDVQGGTAAQQPQPQPQSSSTGRSSAEEIAKQAAKSGSSLHCSIATEVDSASTGEIRTKVFRMGAPLLRSTIPVQIGRSGTGTVPPTPRVEAAASLDEDRTDDEDDDVETVLSLSDVEMEDQVSLAVTMDFPC
eukprot:gnl/TRDRNA2_/TRDRNA2_44180_c0_seq1.p1 gnl/TRDRNA2_/TRDRNA2_44180_c0~~gnl/TRDRNA2_/TRDRNA2_44180_c0_seq1.p1  ORF type:complete len:315 (-),score=57.46 gnl/TRDRNA2_/TRDRNA2_44180_c0_seq1:98-1042(-)